MIYCIAIDDEPRALDVIKSYASKVPFISLTETFTNAIRALEYIQKNRVDLIFLDIEMPNLSGMGFLRTIESQPMVVFTTAFSEFAVDSFEFNVVDYLLKPIDFNRFIKSMNKALKQYTLLSVSGTGKSEGQQLNQKDGHKSGSHVLLKSGIKIFNVFKDDILYIQSDGNYVYFFTPNERIICVYTMKEVLELLSDNDFLRVHKSFIVAIKHIDSIEKHQLTIGQNKIPIGYSYREHFFSRINTK